MFDFSITSVLWTVCPRLYVIRLSYKLLGYSTFLLSFHFYDKNKLSIGATLLLKMEKKSEILPPQARAATKCKSKD